MLILLSSFSPNVSLSFFPFLTVFKFFFFFFDFVQVVAISEKKHSRLCVGHLQLMTNKKVKFSPTDSRLPRVVIPISECPTGKKKQLQIISLCLLLVMCKYFPRIPFEIWSAITVQMN